MATKIAAAKLATASGTSVVIAHGHEQNILLRLIDGEALGTLFPASTSNLESRKRWMLSQPVKGKVVIDPGARIALQKQNRSLLPAGIAKTQGKFERGDIIEIDDSDGNIIGSGISGYSSTDISQIKGSRSERILEILGYAHGDEVIHKDNMLIL